MSGDVNQYLNLIPSQNQAASNFMAMIAATLQPAADIVALLDIIPELLDVDVAVGEQLDFIGQWVGVSRNLTVPLAGVYFSFDTVGLGFDQGVWQEEPLDSGLVSLPDEFYTLLIKAKVLNNTWHCDVPDAYTLMQNLFASLGYQILIQDNGNLTMTLILIAAVPITPIAAALLTSGLLDVKPIGVGIGYAYGVAPLFAFDVENELLAGFDTGSWATLS